MPCQKGNHWVHHCRIWTNKEDLRCCRFLLIPYALTNLVHLILNSTQFQNVVVLLPIIRHFVAAQTAGNIRYCFKMLYSLVKTYFKKITIFLLNTAVLAQREFLQVGYLTKDLVSYCSLTSNDLGRRAVPGISGQRLTQELHWLWYDFNVFMPELSKAIFGILFSIGYVEGTAQLCVPNKDFAIFCVCFLFFVGFFFFKKKKKKKKHKLKMRNNIHDNFVIFFL